jgi:hypothetical protein
MVSSSLPKAVEKSSTKPPTKIVATTAVKSPEMMAMILVMARSWK